MLYKEKDVKVTFGGSYLMLNDQCTLILQPLLTDRQLIDSQKKKKSSGLNTSAE